MRPRNILLILAFCLAGFVISMAQQPQMGSWKLNEAKSKFPPNAGKNTMVVYESAGDNIKVTVDGVDDSGKPVHNEWTGKFDGKPYAITGDSTADMRAYTKVNDHKLTFTNTKGGKKTITGVVTVSADGKTRTVVTKGASGKGGATAVYDKQ
jgi:hypothetical protein